VKLFNSLSKIVLVVEYDGRNYYGFQWQANLPTVQAELERAIRSLTGEKCRVIGASRTDTGVHARGQVVSFRTESELSPQTIMRALNYHLPRDIAVKAAGKVNADFNVRREAVSREYDYYIWNGSSRSPLLEGVAYFVPKKLNVRSMNSACKLLLGEHDLASFATSLGKLKSTVRKVYEAKMVRRNNLIDFHMVANSFLPHQVRNTVGLLVRVGLGKVALEEFRQIVDARTIGLAGPTAPACGLCLTKVNYPGNLELAI
jgi:tRNA pseudouridine38-40 synthase